MVASGESCHSGWEPRTEESSRSQQPHSEEAPNSTDATVSPSKIWPTQQVRTHSQRRHTYSCYSCKRYAAFLKRSPDAATEDMRRLQMHLAERGIGKKS